MFIYFCFAVFSPYIVNETIMYFAAKIDNTNLPDLNYSEYK